MQKSVSKDIKTIQNQEKWLGSQSAVCQPTTRRVKVCIRAHQGGA